MVFQDFHNLRETETVSNSKALTETLEKIPYEFSQFSDFSIEFSDFSRVMISQLLGLDALFFSAVRFLIAKAIPGPSAFRSAAGRSFRF